MGAEDRARRIARHEMHRCGKQQRRQEQDDDGAAEPLEEIARHAEDPAGSHLLEILQIGIAVRIEGGLDIGRRDRASDLVIDPDIAE